MAPDLSHNGAPKQFSRKRRKLSKLQSANVGDFVSLDDLSWREVSFPEKFDDAEGFFGLEEISDVEVDRQDGRTGYKIVSKKSASAKPVQKHVEATPVEESDASDGWSGFEDEPTTGRSVKASASSEADRKSDARPKSKPAIGVSQSTGFGVLRDVEESSVDVREWQDLDLSGTMLSSISKLSFSTPTPIQRSAIPEISQGHDVIGKASTGSGKTLAFGIPIVERFLANHEPAKSGITALIVSPTRELAHQLTSHLMNLCSMPDAPEIATVTGGLSAHKQQRLIARSNILIGTPGRLWELMSSNNELQRKLKAIDFLVLDEADRLLSEGHFQELSEILNVLDSLCDDESKVDTQSERQTLIFSATFQKDLQRKLSGKGKFQPKELLDQAGSMEYLLKKVKFHESRPQFIDVNPDHQMAQNLTERILECEALEKDLYLYSLLLHQSKLSTLVFTNSIASVRRLVPFLQNLNIQAHALHSEMPQKARLRSIERFSSPSTPSSVLIATDVAARGLDIPSVQLIVHYHVPHAADMYVHRSGRTARAEKSGASVLLCSPNEVQGVRRLVAKVHARHAPGNHAANSGLSTIALNPAIVSRLKSRVALSKKITDAALAKEKHASEENWMRTAAEELGVEYDSEEFAKGTKKGRGAGRKKREKDAREVGREELAALRARLKAELKERVNVGVSERYLSAGGLDIEALLRENKQGEFLGTMEIDGLGF